MISVKKIVITGAAGQDGLILGLKLVAAGHKVVGIVRSADQKAFLESYNPAVKSEILDSSTLTSVREFLEKNQPDQIYHLSAKSSVANSWSDSENTLQTNIFHTLNWLNALNELKMHSTRFYHASSSEMFGLPKSHPQTEETLLHPRSPYGVSKVAAHHLVVNYRESFGQFASTGILFNHESPLRDIKFVTRKISQAVAEIARGKRDSLTLGNIEISRDWGWAPDYVDGMISILEHDSPDDFILATGESRTLKEFAATAFQSVGIEDWEKYLTIDSALVRPADVISVVGNSHKARQMLKWSPAVSFESMVKRMVDFDLELIDTGEMNRSWKPE
ncbi:GDPmannose 4,6-dehydratase [Candidatus Planktophila sulfonica]|uniref:GDP-mannose 4,6-dehydratase n=1 Tax=Candidatus Planktophila sulfonica TaxID=1884904 RepID=A0A249KEY5_9ACTN|nr:GDP-mannose 4,6-dehydratase [Candidatus Planktophila sulfonica]ASY15361.1 GDPmannose 4,6-dehydratase [Candidatus Planktophila sulfonica]